MLTGKFTARKRNKWNSWMNSSINEMNEWKSFKVFHIKSFPSCRNLWPGFYTENLKGLFANPSSFFCFRRNNRALVGIKKSINRVFYLFMEIFDSTMIPKAIMARKRLRNKFLKNQPGKLTTLQNSKITVHLLWEMLKESFKEMLVNNMLLEDVTFSKIVIKSLPDKTVAQIKIVWVDESSYLMEKQPFADFFQERCS